MAPVLVLTPHEPSMDVRGGMLGDLSDECHVKQTVYLRPVTVSADDHALAASLAKEAGQLLIDLRARLQTEGVSRAEFKDAGDQASHDFLMSALAEARPGDTVLSEEGKDDRARLSSSRTWVVDPLDGTREFSEVPRVDWAVHVALVEGGSPSAGAVALPAQGLTFSTADSPPIPPAQGHTRIAVSRTRPPAEAESVRTALDGVLVEMGSAGAKAMAILTGDVDVYLHSGGQYEWDSCAPVAVGLAAGLHCTRLDGSPLIYDNEDPYLPDLLICRPELASRTLAVLAH